MGRTNRRSGKQPAPSMRTNKSVRGFIPEWTWNILIMLWAFPFVAQPMVIPTSSMHNTLLTGDHLLVDKLAYSPHNSFEAHLLPYVDVKRGDIVVFRHPAKLSDNLVKRVIGVPGDRIRLSNKWLVLNGGLPAEPYVTHIDPNYRPYRDDFPEGTPDYRPDDRQYERAMAMLRDDVVNGELSPWAITAIHPSTAATGASCRAITSSASRSSFTGRTTRPPKRWPTPASGSTISSTWLSTSHQDPLAPDLRLIHGYPLK
jgi:signal peptidase I